VTFDLPHFRGLNTAADPEDLSPEYLTRCANLYPFGGTLEKTFGFGTRISSAVPVTATALCVLSDARLPVNPCVLALCVQPDGTFLAYAWDPDVTGFWVELSTLGLTVDATTYTGHHYGENPVLIDGDTARFLPGNGTGEGVWLGWIDRDFFDGLYTPTANFHIYPATVSAPDLTVSLTSLPGGNFNADGTGETVYYRWAALYDGTQESLLGDGAASLAMGEDTAAALSFALTEATHNRRWTGLRLYRSTDGTDYGAVVDVDFTRASANAGPTDTDGAYVARDWLHLPGALSATLDSADSYRVLVDGQYYPITEIVGTGNYIVLGGDLTAALTGITDITIEGCTDGGGANNGAKTVTSVTLESGNTRVYVSDTMYNETPALGVLFTGTFYNVVNPQSAGTGSGHTVFALDSAGPITTDEWNVAWELWERTGTSVPVVQGDAGCYTGPYTVIVSEEVIPHRYAGGVLLLGSTPDAYAVLDNTARAVHLAVTLADRNDQAWTLLSPASPYTVSDDTPAAGQVTYTVYDTKLTAGDAPALLNEVSTRVNGQYAAIVSGRLWTANLTLAPESTAEAHTDWAAYSELDQYDVMPVSNVLRVRSGDDRGGEVNGVHEVFGNPVFTKRHAVLTVFGTKDAPDDPTAWVVRKSAHRIGNLAPHGAIVAGDALYVCAIDGIYRLAPNNLAETDQTPTERLRVSDPVRDAYTALTLAEKEAARAVFDPRTSEILWTFGSDVYALNIVSGDWRTVASGVSIALSCPDENGYATVYDSTTGLVSTAAPDYAESTGVDMETKTFALGSDRYEVVRAIELTYESAAALTVSLYGEHGDTPLWTATYPAMSAPGTHTDYPKYRAKKASIRITDASGTGAVTIHRLRVQADVSA
jgi:hypothetical protein